MSAPIVRLRPMAVQDQERVRAWRNLPEIRRWMYTDAVIESDAHAGWFADALKDPRRAYWIIESDQSPVGLVNLYDIDKGRGAASWAYYLADPAVRGRGVGAFVEYLAIETAFNTFALRKLWCEVLVENEAVWRLHQSFGFETEAVYRQHVVKAGTPTDVMGLGLLIDDWKIRRASCRLRLQDKGFQFDDDR